MGQHDMELAKPQLHYWLDFGWCRTVDQTAKLQNVKFQQEVRLSESQQQSSLPMYWLIYA